MRVSGTTLLKRNYWCSFTHINILSKGLIYLVLKSRDFESTVIVDAYYCFLTSLLNRIFILILRKRFKFLLYCLCMSSFYHWAESS